MLTSSQNRRFAPKHPQHAPQQLYPNPGCLFLASFQNQRVAPKHPQQTPQATLPQFWLTTLASLQSRRFAPKHPQQAPSNFTPILADMLTSSQNRRFAPKHTRHVWFLRKIAVLLQSTPNKPPSYFTPILANMFGFFAKSPLYSKAAPASPQATLPQSWLTCLASSQSRRFAATHPLENPNKRRTLIGKSLDSPHSY